MRHRNVTPNQPEPKRATRVQESPAPRKGAPERLRIDADRFAPTPATPAARFGSHYALPTEAAILEVPPNVLRTFVLLASLYRRHRMCKRTGKRKGGPLAVSFRDLAAWTGHCGPTLAAHLDWLAGGGYVRETERGRYRVTGRGIRRTNADGRYCRIPVAKVPAMTGREVTVYATAALSTTKRGRRLITWQGVADALGISVRTVYRALAGLRRLAISLHRFAFRGPEKTVTSTRKKLSRLRAPTGSESVEKVNTGRKHPIHGVRMPRALSAVEFEAKRADAKAQLARVMLARGGGP